MKNPEAYTPTSRKVESCLNALYRAKDKLSPKVPNIKTRTRLGGGLLASLMIVSCNPETGGATPINEKTGETTVQLEPPRGDGIKGFFGDNIIDDDSGLESDNFDEETNEMESAERFVFENGQLVSLGSLPEEMTELSDDVIALLQERMERDSPENREDYSGLERLTPAFEGNADFLYYDQETDTGIRFIFVNPLKMIVDDRYYVVGRHNSGEFATIPIGNYDQASDTMNYIHPPSTYRTYAIQDDEYSGRTSLARITQADENGISYINTYAGCLRGDYEPRAPRVHVVSDSGSDNFDIATFGEISELRTPDINNDERLADQVAVAGLAASSTSCEEYRHQQ